MITSRCTECGATTLDGVLKHSDKCTATALQGITGYGMIPPATEIIFSSEKAKTKFYKNLNQGQGSDLRLDDPEDTTNGTVTSPSNPPHKGTNK